MNHNHHPDRWQRTDERLYVERECHAQPHRRTTSSPTAAAGETLNLEKVMCRRGQVQRRVRHRHVRASSQAGTPRSLDPLPDLVERVVVADPGLRVRILFHLDLELERLLDEPGRVLVGVLDGLRVSVAVERVRTPVVENDLAGLRVRLGDAPVLPRAELEPTPGLGRIADLVGRPDEDPGADRSLASLVGSASFLGGWSPAQPTESTTADTRRTAATRMTRRFVDLSIVDAPCHWGYETELAPPPNVKFTCCGGW